jgi:5-methyltetrahydropteroyltriglutamate--homocysteine methyltransferase
MKPSIPPAFGNELRQAVSDVVKNQAAASVDIVSNGEFGQTELAVSATPRERILNAHVGAAFMAFWGRSAKGDWILRRNRPLDKRRTAISARRCGAILATSKRHWKISRWKRRFCRRSPCSIWVDYENEYYKTEEEFLFAVADALHEEYKAVVDAGFLLQWMTPSSPTFTTAFARRAVTMASGWR